MATYSMNLQGEKQNKRKGRTISAIIHILLLLIAFWPMLKANVDYDKQFAILIEFEKPKVVKPKKKSLEGSKQSSKSEEGSKEESKPKPAPKKDVPKPQKPKTPPVAEVPRKKPKPTPKPQDPIITTPDIQQPKAPDPVEVPDEIDKPTPNTIPVKKPEAPSIDDMLPELDKMIEEEQSSADNTGNADDFGDDSNPERGEGRKGKGQNPQGQGQEEHAGKSSRRGNQGEDLPPGDPGDGLTEGYFETVGKLRRRIKKRANVSDLELKSGTIVLELCINRQGEIIYARGSVKRSSIKNRRLIRLFTRRFREQTLFYPDPKAPTRECGLYTYRISEQYLD